MINKKEFAIFASALRTYYPKEGILPNDKAMELWFKQLEDIPYDVAEVALNKWVSTNKWSPSIADIREQAAELVAGEAKEWDEAWQDVQRAVHHWGSYNKAKALESLDPVTRKCVENIGYYDICMSENISVQRANFRDNYQREIEKEKQRAQMPPKLRALISNMPNLLEGVSD